MAFARWDPFRDLIGVQMRLDRMSGGAAQEWAPAVDLCETAEAYIITAELPGISREQIRVEVRDSKLFLQGRRESRVSCEQYHQVERGHGEFCRSFALPESVDAAAIAADLADGVLTISVPKTPARKIPVK